MGAHHIFHDKSLHEGEPDDDSYRYTRDGSYLRLYREPTNRYVTIEFPDGSLREFDSGTTGLNTTYHLTKIWNPIAAQKTPRPDPDYLIDYDRETDGTRIEDKKWRTVKDRPRSGYNHYPFHRIYRQPQGGHPNRHSGNRRAKLLLIGFRYREKTVNLTCKDTWDGTGPTQGATFLIDIEMPDGTHYNMEEGADDVRYFRTANCDIEDLNGVIMGLDLPTGGELVWRYQEYDFPNGGDDSPFNTSAGLLFRKLRDRNGNDVGNPWRWTVFPSLGQGPGTL